MSTLYNGAMDDKAKQKVMIAMSGGVDSSAAARLVVDSGCHAAGITCKMFGANVLDGEEGFDGFMDDVEDAKQVCRKLGIEHYVFNYKEPFEACVIQKFVDEYLQGRTPNPCVDCNRHVKFGALNRRRQELGFDKLATGHYARVEFDEKSGRWALKRARHIEKDQSYMLCHLTQDQLAHAMFPLGELSKEEVRALAAEAGFDNAEKSESQDICFIPDGDYASFIERWECNRECASSADDKGARHLPFAPMESARGPIENVDGKQLGEHDGLLHYTIGQRKGIGIAAGEPLYVVAKDGERNALVVGTHDELMTRAVTADDVNYVALTPENSDGIEVRVFAKTSYRQVPRPAVARFSGNGVTLEFDEPLPRPAAGQALALYDGEIGETVLAGATIA